MLDNLLSALFLAEVRAAHYRNTHMNMIVTLLHDVHADSGQVFKKGSKVELADWGPFDDPEDILRDVEFHRGAVDIILPDGEVRTVEPDVVDLIGLL